MRLRTLALSACILMGASGFSQSYKEEIQTLLSRQSDAWNSGNIIEFMDGYIRTDDLHFLGSSGLTSGWDATLERYRRTYPDTMTMGKLKFTLHEITPRTDDVCTVIGQYFLRRATLDDLSGYFLLVVVRTEEGWKIAADSTH